MVRARLERGGWWRAVCWGLVAARVGRAFFFEGFLNGKAAGTISSRETVTVMHRTIPYSTMQVQVNKARSPRNPATSLLA